MKNLKLFSALIIVMTFVFASCTKDSSAIYGDFPVLEKLDNPEFDAKLAPDSEDENETVYKEQAGTIIHGNCGFMIQLRDGTTAQIRTRESDNLTFQVGARVVVRYLESDRTPECKIADKVITVYHVSWKVIGDPDIDPADLAYKAMKPETQKGILLTVRHCKTLIKFEDGTIAEPVELPVEFIGKSNVDVIVTFVLSDKDLACQYADENIKVLKIKRYIKPVPMPETDER